LYNEIICNKIANKFNMVNGIPNNEFNVSEPNMIFWNQNCKSNVINTTNNNFDNNKLCEFMKDKENFNRARILLQCSGSILQEGKFLGAGTTSNRYFIITVKQLSGANDDRYRTLNIEKNIGKQIKIYCDINNNIIGWAVADDWIYPGMFGNLTVKDFGIFEIPSSAIEIYDKPVGTGKRNKILLWFNGPRDKVTINNPRQAIKDIMTKQPSNVECSYGADKDTFLGSVGFIGSVQYSF